jgi:hypothetical protein
VSTGTQSYTIRGEKIISGGMLQRHAIACRDYPRDSEASQISLTDGEGHLLGLVRVGQGKRDPQRGCVYPFVLSGVPRARLYNFHVGPPTGHVIESYSFAELEQLGWKVVLHLRRK